MSAIIITKDNFQEEILKSNLPVLIDFWAPWCGPCQALLPTIEELAEELNGKVKVCKVNVDENKELARQFRIMSVPSLMIFDKGQLKGSSVGLKSKSEILEMLKF